MGLKIARALIKVALILVAFSWLEQRLYAEDPVVQVPNLEFLDPRNYPFKVGGPFKVNVNYSAVGSAGRLDDLRVRVFRGTIEELISLIGKRTPDGCREYVSSVYEPLEYNGGLDFGLNFNEYWLQPLGFSSLTDGHFVLVLELGGSKERVFRLRESSVKDYFQQGFPFVIRADRAIDPAEARAVIETMQRQPPPQVVDVRCYRFAVERLGQMSTMALEATPCHMGQPPESAGETEEVQQSRR